MLLEELRRQEVKLDNTMLSREFSRDSSDQTSSKASGSKSFTSPAATNTNTTEGLLLFPDSETTQIPIYVELQSEGFNESNKRYMKKFSRHTPSFRVPNIELDYILSVSIYPVDHYPCCILRCPIQFLPGDDLIEVDAPPAWEAFPAVEAIQIQDDEERVETCSVQMEPEEGDFSLENKEIELPPEYIH
jgi:hypothetical protein